MATYNCKSSEELRQALMKEITSTMTKARKQIESKNEKHINAYYDEGHPVRYKRTGTLPNAAYTSPVVRVGGYMSVFTTMDDESRVHWDTGTFTSAQVMQATENHTSGVLGKSHYWRDTEEEIEPLINTLFSEKFS